jgi:3-oxoacyl-[acyl-carrier-protein] synthase-3
MHQNVNIIGSGIYHPSNKVDNSFFSNHFKKLNIEVEHLLQHLSRKTRYLVDNDHENALTMAINASIKALEKAKITPDQLDMIVFASDTPQYFSPSNALLINKEIGASNAHIVYDINSNCTGALAALDQISRYLKTKKNIRHVLLASAMLISPVAKKDDPIVYANLSDAGAALVLENVDEKEERGFIDSKYFTDSNYHHTIMNPACGISRIANPDINPEEKKMQWNPFDFGFLSDNWSKLIKDLVLENQISLKDIHHYIFSQFSKPDAEETLRKLDTDINQHTYIGDQYGYTGVTSPIIALDKALSDKKIKKGSKVVLCSVAAGYSMSAVLFQF